MAHKGIETQWIISNTGWDELDILCIQLYDCVLRPEVFGSVIAERYRGCDIALMLDQGILELTQEGFPPLTYRINTTLALQEEQQ